MSKEGLIIPPMRGILAVNDGIRPALKDLRIRNGLTQLAVAQRGGIPRRSINYLENSPRDPLIDTLIWYAIGVDDEFAIALVVGDQRVLAASEEIIPTLIAIRKDLGIVQTDVATKLSVTQSKISELETGQKTPKVSKVIKYAEAIHPRLALGLLDSRA